MRLLWWQAEKGPIPDDLKAISSILRVHHATAKRLWGVLQTKFQEVSLESDRGSKRGSDRGSDRGSKG